MSIIENVNLRTLTSTDIPRLSELRPTYTSGTIIAVERTGTGFSIHWNLVERKLPRAFDKGTLYDFNEDSQALVRDRCERPDDTCQRVLEHNGRLVGLLELEQHYWNDTVFL